MKRFGIFVALCMTAQLVLAWGNTGHRAAAEIAYDNLSKKAKREIKMILGDDYLPIYSNWADNVKSDRTDSLKEYGRMPHYTNMEPGETYQESEKREGGDSYTIYNDMVQILKSDESSVAEKNIALKLIIHLVADMHQPMHCGRAGDLGGNRVEVTWFGRPTNLHHVWDSDLVNYYNLSYTELASFISTSTKADKKVLQSTDAVVWINESKVYADEIYDTVGEGKFSYAYGYKYEDVVFSQLEKAGIRLAGVLNEIYK